MTSFERLKKNLKELPGIGDKSAERLIFFLISKGKDFSKELSESILELSENMKVCSICGSIDETDPCSICSNGKRDENILMVLEKPRDLFIFERTKRFNGLYHILGGLISPLDGITPEKLSFDKLLQRVEKGNIKEVIIALSPSTEGETTTIYLTKLLKDKVERITTIARGIPFGTDFEYIDDFTLQCSVEKRQNLD